MIYLVWNRTRKLCATSKPLTTLIALTGLLILLAQPTCARAIELDYLVVKLPVDVRGTAALNRAQDILSRYSPQRVEALLVPGWFRIFAPANALDRIQTRLSQDPTILAVERDERVHAMFTPNDPYWNVQWGPLKIDAPGAWEITTGSAQVIMAIIDTGVDLNHLDLVNQLWVNPGEIPNDGLDNEGNGFVDDLHGWRFLAGGQSNNVQDDHGHGTHVAGIAGAQGNNGIGIAGMCWGCRLMILKALDSSGKGRYSDVADAIVYAVDNGARIINLSLGGASSTQELEEAVNYASAQDALVVAAAGNYGSSVYYYPGAYPAAFAVAATDSADQHPSYSNSGPEVDIAAPGTDIYSTCMSSSYCYKSGTSMATPHVSGLAALIWTQHYTYTAGQVRQILVNTAVDIDSPGWDPHTGWGRIDAQQALSATLESLAIPYIYYFPLVIRQ